MGKKVEKAIKSGKESTLDDGDKSPEPYQCTGHFHSDFTELCKEKNMYKPPSVVPRPKRPPSPSQNTTSDGNAAGGGKRGGKEDKKAAAAAAAQQLEEEQESQEDKEVIEFLGFKPKTFVLKDHIEFMKPVVHVEMDHPDKQDTVTEIFVRGWLIDCEMMNTFTQSIQKLSRLHSLHFWRVGFTSERVKELADCLLSCETVKLLHIEANEALENENWHEFVKEENHITKLILRYNHISSEGAKAIAANLGSIKTANSKLLCLDLSANKIGDEGAVAMATALRTNRCLLQLSLSNNSIGDVGAIALAEVISGIFLTQEEIIERRQLMSDKNLANRLKSASTMNLESRPNSSVVGASPPPSRRGESKDRPGSVRSNDRERAGSKGGRDSKTSSKKGGKDSKEKDDKGKGKKDEKSPASGKKGATVAADGKTAGKKGGKSGKASKTVISTEVSEVVSTFESPESTNPLLEKADGSVEHGKLLIPGNYVLLMLNLARNNITEKAVELFKKSMINQTNLIKLGAKMNGTGMLKLFLKGNNVNEECAAMKKLEDLMSARDPFGKPLQTTPEADN